MRAKKLIHLANTEIDFSNSEILKTLFSNSNQGIAIVGARGEIFKFNSALSELLNYTSNDFSEISLFNVLGESSVTLFKDMLGHLSVKEGSIEESLILITKDAKKIVCDVSLSTVKTGLKGYGLLTISPEIPKVEKNEFYKFSELFSKISENLNEGIFRSSPDEGMIYVNKPFARLFGYESVGEVIKQRPGGFYFDSNEKSRVAELIQNNGALVNEVILFARKDGSSFWGLVNCSVNTEYDGCVFYDGAVVDITDQKKSEELLVQKNKELKKINAQMDRFMYSAYHDVRAPIASVLGLTNILKMELNEQRYDAYFDKIEESLNKLDYFVNDVKNFSQNARQRIESKRIDFNSLIVSTWRKFKHVHETIDLSVTVEEGIIFYSDQVRLGLILENVLKNCTQFMDSNKLENYIKISVKMASDKVIIEVVDNGIGIGKTHLEKIFNMFYRATENSKGAGLGLYISKETVIKLRGNISVESELGLGTIVNIEIPNDQKGKLISRKLTLLKH
ncbi:PAS domain-containing sensor histidine kinase [Fulvivirga lutimaris]|uniref:PAS domain-containing sensor histidine kinase n=1 Tax=Fulvivirga lutimaris TaxID=1819566 RepID=UPI0012BC96B8|nr:PAS domain-containing sensor histidine kinase [Fulvivirga lutimaris]MTI40049.1 PAS domain S-box protein [Fulvivirga lutimaris]